MTDHPSLFDEYAHARRGDPHTSHEAAASLPSDKIRASQNAVRRILGQFGPMCDAALVDMYQSLCAQGWDLPRQSPSGIRTRRSELAEKGMVWATGDHVLMPSGRRAIVWGAAHV